jgi:hypothetical protein
LLVGVFSTVDVVANTVQLPHIADLFAANFVVFVAGGAFCANYQKKPA